MASAKKTQRLLLLAKEIVRLENELALTQAEFERVSAGSDESPAEPASPPKPPLARTSSFPQRVQSALDMSPRPLTAGEIAVQIGEPRSIDTIRAALSKLIGRGTAERVDVGTYRSLLGGHRTAAGEDD